MGAWLQRHVPTDQRYPGRHLEPPGRRKPGTCRRTERHHAPAGSASLPVPARPRHPRDRYAQARRPLDARGRRYRHGARGGGLRRCLAALGLTEGAEVSERQMELLFGMLRHADADRIERGLLDDGADPATARLATVLGQPIEEIEVRKQTPLLALDFTFRPQASLIVLWALGDARTRRITERAHERAIAKALRWLEDEVAETRWSSGRGRAKTSALVVAAFRHFDNRDGFPLLHDHCLVLNRVQRLDADGEPVV
ncbi:MobF family relaxase [Streptomyces sp. NPDC058424]|uniref:MobF family relaxase n=1 Tax=Streptomyces sp. NPDC058424 TaxID=3346491 RepID=UPI00366280AA